ncbi:MAG: riboflavin synthase subunit alpha [Nitrospirae bacterium GWD2_57_9]|nr:MAG: riboflavin synthase subunit alpha [Nitrospirae bacterium GWD2_57_9]OGW46192.1 MAG: riboflavin synthase subunit alpha [Nitrospirae bacterium GWC2_57_9]
MFTGIIEEMGSVKSFKREAGAARLMISASSVLSGTAIGDSICVNGVCLTVVDMTAGDFSADVAVETLNVTNLGELKIGARVNLERALQLSARIGGHLVSGHVDATGRIRSRREEGNGWRIFIEAGDAVLRYVIKKGSIAIDGISLTVAELDKSGFSIAMIPHTAKLTTLGFKSVGDSVNLEVDIIGKYVERLLSGRIEGGVSLDLLKKNGFA